MAIQGCVGRGKDGDNDDNNLIDSADTVATTTLFSAHPNRGASRVFRTAELRPKQDEAITQLVQNKKQIANSSLLT